MPTRYRDIPTLFFESLDKQYKRLRRMLQIAIHDCKNFALGLLPALHHSASQASLMQCVATREDLGTHCIISCTTCHVPSGLSSSTTMTSNACPVSFKTS